MKYHFTLEYKRLCRAIESAGFNAVRVIIVLCILISFIMAYAVVMKDKSSSALLLAAVLCSSLAFRKSRVEFYKKIYPKGYWTKIQTMEVALLISPFFILLLLSGAISFAFALLALAISIPFLSTSLKLNSSRFKLPPFPTPFKRHPFEFISGFRKTWPLFLVPIFFFHKGVELSNSNFSVFAVLIGVLIPGFYFSKPEPISYLTIYNRNARNFLNHKIAYVIKNTAVISVPFVLAGLYLFPESYGLVLAALLFGFLFSVSAMLGKYAYFPNELNPVQSTSLILSLMMPPLLLLVLPAFYKKALSNLKPFLS